MQRRRARFCSLPAEALAGRLVRGGWVFCSKRLARKRIGELEIVLTVEAEHAGKAICRILTFDEYWLSLGLMLRYERPERRRAAFRVIECNPLAGGAATDRPAPVLELVHGARRVRPAPGTRAAEDDGPRAA